MSEEKTNEHDPQRLGHHERGFNVRRLDNRVCILCSQHCGIPDGSYWYVSIELLVHPHAEIPGLAPNAWQHVQGSALTSPRGGIAAAERLARERYANVEKELDRLLPDWRMLIGIPKEKSTCES